MLGTIYARYYQKKEISLNNKNGSPLQAPMKQKVRQIVWLLFVVTLLVLVMGYLQMQAMGAVRAYVAGESLWAKAQKDAVMELREYIHNSDEKNFEKVHEALRINLADKQARLALQEATPDKTVAYNALLAGGNHPEDIPSMIRLFVWFQNVYPMKQAIEIWADADQGIEQLRQLSYRIHRTRQNDPQRALAEFDFELNQLHHKLNELETAFSSVLSSGARWMKNVFIVTNIVLLTLALVVISLIARKILSDIDVTESYLRISESRFKALNDSNIIGILIWESNGDLSDANDASLDILGYSREELEAGKINWREITPEDSQLADENAMREIEATGSCTPFHKEYIHKSGRRIPVFLGCALMDGAKDKGIAFVVDRSHEKALEQDLKMMAHYDHLTGLANRSLYSDRLSTAITRAQRHRRQCALLFLDLDKFKAVNDQYGHEGGDLILRQVAKRLLAVSRKSDTIGRLGGDEFVVIIEELAETIQATQVAKKIIEQLIEPFYINGNEVLIGCSIGVAIYPDHAYSSEDLTRSADIAMYAAKERGKPHFYVYREPPEEKCPSVIEAVTSSSNMRGL